MPPSLPLCRVSPLRLILLRVLSFRYPRLLHIMQTTLPPPRADSRRPRGPLNVLGLPAASHRRHNATPSWSSRIRRSCRLYGPSPPCRSFDRGFGRIPTWPNPRRLLARLSRKRVLAMQISHVMLAPCHLVTSRQRYLLLMPRTRELVLTRQRRSI